MRGLGTGIIVVWLAVLSPCVLEPFCVSASRVGVQCAACACASICIALSVNICPRLPPALTQSWQES